jgi:ABC-type multidrug transport system fused ATPase/permease subunit
LDAVTTEHQGFNPQIKLDKVSFSYPGSTTKTLSEIDLMIEIGKKIAIVGPSGAGKTTLVDLILGIIPVDAGKITISGFEPLQSIKKWPGAIAYVPQDVMIFDASILENIALGFPSEPITKSLAEDALQEAQLIDFVDNLPEGINTRVGNRGMKLSGGQRQRLGIARALFTRPKLIILDEATSALDGQTESNMTASILGLDQTVTVLMIAHRLSTVRDADLVIYIENGEIKARGSFDEVRYQVPDFDSQAKLMGL